MSYKNLADLKKLGNDYRFLLCADMYQLTMSAVYFAENRESEEVVFECFVRGIKTEVNNKGDFYYFSGEKVINKMMNKIKEIFLNDEQRNAFVESFLEMVIPKVAENKKNIVEKAVREKIKEEIKFDYRVLKENTLVTPLIPVFMFKGERWIGQLIETMITNIINGKTGYNTALKTGNLNQEEIIRFKNITLGIFDEELPDDEIFNKYSEKLEKRADEYKNSINEFGEITEAAFRRAPGFYAAYIASDIALKKEWLATSNTTLYFIEGKNILNKIGGSFAHSFVMGYKNEAEAFKKWLEYYPKSILLIDSYDVMSAVDTIINEKMDCSYVRIDSEPLDIYAKDVQRKFLNAGLKTKIYLSSDITPERIIEFKQNNIPFARIMAGTKYINCWEVEKINCGFVYKITVNSINGKINFPEKKATGKKNYPGYKYVIFGKNEVVMYYSNKNVNIKFGFDYMTEAEKISNVLRIERVK